MCLSTGTVAMETSNSLTNDMSYQIRPASILVKLKAFKVSGGTQTVSRVLIGLR